MGWGVSGGDELPEGRLAVSGDDQGVGHFEGQFAATGHSLGTFAVPCGQGPFQCDGPGGSVI